jgi:hypothetical protein
MATKLRKSGKEVAKQSWAKTDVRYWEAAVFKPKFSRKKDPDEAEPEDGEKTGARETKHYSVRISHQGKRHTIPLAMANKGDAARRARDIYLSLVSSGWQETLEKFHPHHINRPALGQEDQEQATVGAYIDLAKTLTGVAPRSISGYVTSLRMIAASVAGVKNAASRFDYKKGGRDEWVKKVDAVPLSALTSTAIEEWKHRFVKKRKGNPVEERKARNSANSFIRQARSLFAPKITKHVGAMVSLPDPIPFHDVSLYPRSSMRYVSRIDIRKIVAAAHEELGGPRSEDEKPQQHVSRIEQFKIFLLAAFGGLRRNEIDKLLWSQVDLKNGIIEIRETPYFKPKSEESRGQIEIEPEVVEVLTQLRKGSKDPFVIRATGGKKKLKSAQWYRAARHFDGLLGWLRNQGVADLKPLHVLRKEAGNLICGAEGLHAASRFLRHGDVRVTAEHYLDKKAQVTVGMGSLLRQEKPPEDEASAI